MRAQGFLNELQLLSLKVADQLKWLMDSGDFKQKIRKDDLHRNKWNENLTGNGEIRRNQASTSGFSQKSSMAAGWSSVVVILILW